METVFNVSLGGVSTGTITPTDGNIWLYISSTSVNTVISGMQMFDLTAMFGSTIADYIYSLEQSTAGAGVAWFRKLFPKPYYSYNAGELLSVNAVGKKTVGFNQFDKTTVVNGKYYTKAGNENTSTDYFHSVFIRVVPNTSYYLKAKNMAGVWNVVYFDGDKNGLNSAMQVYPADASGGTFTTPADCHYVAVNGNASNPADNICLSLVWDGSRDGEYEEYEAHEYALDDLTLRGIPKLDASNNLYYDGDTYPPSGEIQRKIVEVTIPADVTTWSTYAGKSFVAIAFSAVGITNIKSGTLAERMSNSIANIAKGTGWDNLKNGSEIGYVLSSDNWLGINIGIVDPTQAQINQWLTDHPLTIQYVAETPTTEQADPFVQPFVVDDFGTEAFIDGEFEDGDRDVAIPVGHVTQYQANLRAKLEMAPDSPGDGDGDYVVRQTAGKNSYVPLLFPASDIPAPPATDGSYVLSLTVSSGAASYSWKPAT